MLSWETCIMSYDNVKELANKFNDEKALKFLKNNFFEGWIHVKIEIKNLSCDEAMKIKMDIMNNSYKDNDWYPPKDKLKIVQMYGWVKKGDDNFEWKRYENDLS